MEKFLALRRNYLAAEVHTSVEEANQAPDINIRSQRSMDTVEQYIHFCRHNLGKPPTHLRCPKEKLPRSRWSAVHLFQAELPMDDDCTVVVLNYLGSGAQLRQSEEKLKAEAIDSCFQ